MSFECAFLPPIKTQLPLQTSSDVTPTVLINHNTPALTLVPGCLELVSKARRQRLLTVLANSPEEWEDSSRSAPLLGI